MGCIELIEQYNLDCNCCGSCHDDVAEWGYDYCCQIEIDGKEYNCCCAIFRALEKKGIDTGTYN